MRHFNKRKREGNPHKERRRRCAVAFFFPGVVVAGGASFAPLNSGFVPHLLRRGKRFRVFRIRRRFRRENVGFCHRRFDVVLPLLRAKRRRRQRITVGRKPPRRRSRIRGRFCSTDARQISPRSKRTRFYRRIRPS